jgi:hypothetical protein
MVEDCAKIARATPDVENFSTGAQEREKMVDGVGVHMRRADGRIVADSSGSLFIQNNL